MPNLSKERLLQTWSGLSIGVLSTCGAPCDQIEFQPWICQPKILNNFHLAGDWTCIQCTRRKLWSNYRQHGDTDTMFAYVDPRDHIDFPSLLGDRRLTGSEKIYRACFYIIIREKQQTSL